MSQMSLAVAEALLESVQPTPRHWAQHFCDGFHRDPREGYASGFHAFLSQVTDGQHFLERIRPHSDRSGACMRALPIGLLPDVGQVLTLAEGQARVTHDTPGGVLSAQAVALAAHYYLYGLGPRPEVCEYVAAQIGGDWTGWRGKVGALGLQADRAALSALRQCSSMAELLRHCVDYSGDVDTVACIALGAAACCPDYRRDLPRVLYENLENGAYGKDYVQPASPVGSAFSRDDPDMTRLTLVRGDITEQDVDAIVNATIHRAGGAAILEDCKAIRARQAVRGCHCKSSKNATKPVSASLMSRRRSRSIGKIFQSRLSLLSVPAPRRDRLPS